MTSKIRTVILLSLILLFLPRYSRAKEKLEMEVRAVSDSFVRLRISIPGTSVKGTAGGGSKGYIKGRIIIPYEKKEIGKELKFDFLYDVFKANQWAGRERGSFQMKLNPDKFPHRLLLISQKGKDISKYQLFLFSLNKAVFKSGEKGYLRIQKTDKLNTPDSGFACFLKDVFPFSPDSSWIKLPIAEESEGLYSFSVPPLPNSVYQLKIVYGVKDKLNIDSTPFGDFVVGISSFDPNVSIFVDRNRRVFLQGEKAEINIFLQGSNSFDGKLELFSDTLLLGQDNVSFTRKGTFSYLIDTSVISPGKHILKAVLANKAESRYPFTIVSSVLPSHLVRLDYHFFQGLTAPVSLFGMSFSDIARNVSYYTDAVTEGGGCYECIDELYRKRMTFSPADKYREIRDFVDKYSLYLPEERTYNPITREQILESLLEYQVSDFLRPSFIRYLAHSIPEDENRRYRHIQLFAQTFRNYPSFAGINYHDDAYALGYGETGWMDGRRKERMEALKKRFKERYGKEPQEDRKNWIDFINRIFPEVYERYQDGMKQIDKDLIGTSQEVPDAGAADGFYIPNVYNNLDAVTYLSYCDYERFPLQEIFQASLYKAGIRRKPVYSAHYCNPGGCCPTTTRCREMMQASTITEGMGFMDINGALAPAAVEGNAVLSKGGDHGRISYRVREIVRVMAELYKRYGDFFLSLKRDEKIGLLFSYTQAASEPTGSATDHKYTIFEAYSDFARAHFPADIITEEEIAKGKVNPVREVPFSNGVKDYNAIVLIGIKVPLPEEVKDGLRKFQEQGGIVFASSDSVSQVEDTKVIPTTFSSYNIHWGGIDGNLEHKMFYDIAVKQGPAIRKAVSTCIKEKFSCDNPRVFLFTRKGGSGYYLFTLHDTPPAFDWGLPFSQDASEIFTNPKLLRQYRKTHYKAPVINRLYQHWIIPIKEKIKVAGLDGYCCYDILEGKKISIKDSFLEADFTRLEGKIYAFLPEEIARVNLTVSSNPFAYKVSLSGRRRKEIEVPVPVEIVVNNGKGETLYHLFRSSPFSEELPLADHGEYTIKVKELFSGYFAEKSFSIKKSALAEKSVKRLSDIPVFDGEAINRFLKEKKKITVYLDEKQKNIFPLAEEIKRRLGNRVEIKEISEDKIKDIPLKWKYTEEELSLKKELEEGKIIGRRKNVRDVKIGYPDPDPDYMLEEDVILLGTPGKNRLVDEVFKSNLAPRLCSENYPGKGRGLIFYLWSPFSAHRDCICIFGSDEEGLKKTVDRFISVAGRKNIPSDISNPPRLFSSHEISPLSGKHKFSGRGVNPVRELHFLTGLKSAAFSNGVKYGKEKTSFIQEFTPGYTDAVIYPIATSKDDKRIIVGTDAFGYNFFCLNNKGKVLWKNKVRDLLCQDVGISGDMAAAGIIHSDKRCAESSIFVYNSDGKFLWKEAGFIHSALDQFVLLPDGKGIIINKGNYLIAFDKDHQELWRYKPESGKDEEFRKLSLSPDGKYLAAGAWATGDLVRAQPAHSIALIGTADGKEVWRKKGGVDTWAFGIDILPNAQLIAVGNYEGSISIFSKQGQKIFSYLLPGAKPDEPVRKDFIPAPSGIFDLKFSSDGKYLLVKRGAFDFNAYLIKIHENKIIPLPTEGLISGIDVFGDNLFAVGSFDKKVRLFDEKGNLLWEKDVEGGSRVKFSPDGSLLAGTTQGILYSFNKKGKLLWEADLGKEGYIPDLNEFLGKQK